MDNPNIIIYSNHLEINNVTALKEFNPEVFSISINNEDYVVKGTDLELKSVLNNNTTIKIIGIVNSIEKKKLNKEKNKSFIKRLFN